MALTDIIDNPTAYVLSPSAKAGMMEDENPLQERRRRKAEREKELYLKALRSVLTEFGEPNEPTVEVTGRKVKDVKKAKESPADAQRRYYWEHKANLTSDDQEKRARAEAFMEKKRASNRRYRAEHPKAKRRKASKPADLSGVTSEVIAGLAMNYATTNSRHRCGYQGEGCLGCEYSLRGDCDHREMRKAFMTGALEVMNIIIMNNEKIRTKP